MLNTRDFLLTAAKPECREAVDTGSDQAGSTNARVSQRLTVRRSTTQRLELAQHLCSKLSSSELNWWFNGGLGTILSEIYQPDLWTP